jgi:hypothetical protein
MILAFYITLISRGGVMGFFSKKNIPIPNVAEKNILILVERKTKSDSEFLSCNLMSLNRLCLSHIRFFEKLMNQANRRSSMMMIQFETKKRKMASCEITHDSFALACGK